MISVPPLYWLIQAHSNECEWQSLKTNEAFTDRFGIIKAPNRLRVTEEQKIYEKLIQGSKLASAPCAGDVGELLSEVSQARKLDAVREIAGL